MTVMNLKHLCHEEKLERDLLDPPLSGGEDGGDGDGGVDMELDESLIRAEECDQLLGRVLEGKIDFGWFSPTSFLALNSLLA
jgi:hypothetical protein